VTYPVAFSVFHHHPLTNPELSSRFALKWLFIRHVYSSNLEQHCMQNRLLHKRVVMHLAEFPGRRESPIQQDLDSGTGSLVVVRVFAVLASACSKPTLNYYQPGFREDSDF
jgi:hypothetical protein